MNHRYLLGLDVGSSSVKASLVDTDNGQAAASAFYPKHEANISAPQKGWAEQEPESWWNYACQSVAQVMHDVEAKPEDVAAVGISYQMHGLVCVDKANRPLRPSIIWCDSRAVGEGNRAFQGLGSDWCMSHLLNSPGNFTAAKLAWVKDNEPEIFERINKVMLPGDYIAMRLTGEINTTVSGLSEGTLWDFKEQRVAKELLQYYHIPEEILSPIVPTFGDQGRITEAAAKEMGLKEGTPVSYRAGDQPNNALSLNVLNPGEIASTAGTSGVVYGVMDHPSCDAKSRVNVFAHVNYTREQERLGVLLCINGTGILNAWMHRNVVPADMDYAEMNNVAAQAPIGSDGVVVIPFGNGAERILENKETGCSIHGLNFNKHNRSHLFRAAQEGIVFSFCYGMEIMSQMGMSIRRIHAGRANMFLSPLFRNTLAGVSGATISLYDTDGSVGAAKGAGIGSGIYKDSNEAFSTLRLLETIEPDQQHEAEYRAAYERWKEAMQCIINNA
ncbi:MAG: xylulokinase [Prevotella sp.]|jgi:xylulokinase